MDPETTMSAATADFVRGRVVAATQVLLAEHGLGVSMEQIAASAGVGRRSLFRYFGSREALVASALSETVSAFGARLVALLDTQKSFSDWLVALLTEVQQSQLEAGCGFWELTAAGEDGLPALLEALNRQRIDNRWRWTEDAAHRAWSLAGGDGRLPDLVLETFALVLSRFATRSQVEEWGLVPERAVASNAAILTAVIQSELRGRQRE